MFPGPRSLPPWREPPPTRSRPTPARAETGNQDFLAKAEAHKKAKGCTMAEAISAVAKDDPEGYEAYIKAASDRKGRR